MPQLSPRFANVYKINAHSIDRHVYCACNGLYVIYVHTVALRMLLPGLVVMATDAGIDDPWVRKGRVTRFLTRGAALMIFIREVTLTNEYK